MDEALPLTSRCTLVGRAALCDLIVRHESISRQVIFTPTPPTPPPPPTPPHTPPNPPLPYTNTPYTSTLHSPTHTLLSQHAAFLHADGP